MAIEKRTRADALAASTAASQRDFGRRPRPARQAAVGSRAQRPAQCQPHHRPPRIGRSAKRGPDLSRPGQGRLRQQAQGTAGHPDAEGLRRSHGAAQGTRRATSSCRSSRCRHPTDVAEKLRIECDVTVCKIRRLRFLDNLPVSVDESYLPLDVGSGLAAKDLATRDIFLIIENDFSIDLGQAQLAIEAVAATRETAALLGVDEGAPVLRIERLTFSADGRPLDFEYLVYRSDRFRYELSIQRRHPAKETPHAWFHAGPSHRGHRRPRLPPSSAYGGPSRRSRSSIRCSFRRRPWSSPPRRRCWKAAFCSATSRFRLAARRSASWPG